MSTPTLIDPRATVAAAIRAGLVTVAPTAQLSASTILRKMPPKKGDVVSRTAQAHAMAAAGWPKERIAKNLDVSVQSVRNYLRTP